MPLNLNDLLPLWERNSRTPCTSPNSMAWGGAMWTSLWRRAASTSSGMDEY